MALEDLLPATLLPATILAGGRSRRFGEDKARVLVNSQPLILSLSQQLTAAGHSVTYVSDRADRYADLGITCLVDAQADSVPLAGLATALTHQRQQPDGSPWLLLISCDQLRWQSDWSDRLRSAIEACQAAQSNCQAIVFASTVWQPLPALYHVDLIEVIAQRLAARQLSLHGLLEACQVAGRCMQITVDDPPNRWSFNTPAELNQLLA